MKNAAFLRKLLICCFMFSLPVLSFAQSGLGKVLYVYYRVNGVVSFEMEGSVNGPHSCGSNPFYWFDATSPGGKVALAGLLLAYNQKKNIEVFAATSGGGMCGTGDFASYQRIEMLTAYPE